MKVNEKKSALCAVIFILFITAALLHGNTIHGRLTGVNWFGFETGNYVVHGIWTRDWWLSTEPPVVLSADIQEIGYEEDLPNGGISKFAPRMFRASENGSVKTVALTGHSAMNAGDAGLDL